ncbi:hypothetical protein [Lactococcus petauri]|nr:hypothetical protein [Lactococcus petauri]MDT2526398.1 hypothetical protein [Lactococcus petauri]MDT2559408.1 hypothetical protein [Lactococcus petauri]MDT2567981.1 hypothetical protein [Lactococcus petauri]MDT2584748.1 hypothetical protein [Lactococcus petauri]MDT2587185.1 hypothetical protein [Lactococcus petauri]
MSKIYIEGRFKMPVINTDEFGYDEEEVKKLNWEDFAKDEFWNSCDDMGELEDKYDITFHKVQPQLTIPKSIADELDNIFNEFVSIKNSRSIWGLLWRAEEIDDETGMRLEWLLPDENQVNIGIAYLAGKALGVDLVKVVEG